MILNIPASVPFFVMVSSEAVQGHGGRLSREVESWIQILEECL